MEAAVKDISVKFDDLAKKDLMSRIRIERKNATENFGKECNEDAALINEVHGYDVKGMRSYAKEDLPKAKKALRVVGLAMLSLSALTLISGSASLATPTYSDTGMIAKRLCMTALTTGAICIPIGVTLKNDIVKDKKILDTLDKWEDYYLNEQKFTINPEN